MGLNWLTFFVAGSQSIRSLRPRTAGLSEINLDVCGTAGPTNVTVEREANAAGSPFTRAALIV
jgi:hypothetical protein